jgi:serine/threonine protein kinase
MDINEVWSEWKTEKLIDEDSCGKIYKCSKTTNGKVEYCAVKVISVPQSNLGTDAIRLDSMTASETKEYYREIVNEFVNEIKLLQKLKKCSNIVHMYDYKVVERTESIGWDIFIRMELLTTFTEYVSDKEISREDILNFGLNICNALVECEKYNIIHRDIKPENIFVYDDGIYKLGDFGTAKEFEQTLASYSMKGTYNYMSPEVFNGKKYDARADIYSLGLVMYLMMNNNRVPFIDPDKQMVKHQDRVDALSKRLKGDPMPKPKNADENLSAIILKACAFNPDDRYINARELRAALETELDNTKKRNKFQIVCSNVGYTVKRHKIISSIIAAVLIIAIIGGTAFAHRNTVATWIEIEPSTTEVSAEKNTSETSKSNDQFDELGFDASESNNGIAIVGNTAAVADTTGVKIVDTLNGNEEQIYKKNECYSIALNGKKVCFVHSLGKNTQRDEINSEILMYDLTDKKQEKITNINGDYIRIIYFNNDCVFYENFGGLYKYNINTQKIEQILSGDYYFSMYNYKNGYIFSTVGLYGNTGTDNINMDGICFSIYVYNIVSGVSSKIDSNCNGDSISFIGNDLYYLQYNYNPSTNNSISRLVKYSYTDDKRTAMSIYYYDIECYTSDYIITRKEMKNAGDGYYQYNMIDLKTNATVQIDTPTDVNIDNLNQYNDGIYIINNLVFAFSYDKSHKFHLYKVKSDGTIEKYKYAQLSGDISNFYSYFVTDNMFLKSGYIINSKAVCCKLLPDS